MARHIPQRSRWALPFFAFAAVVSSLAFGGCGRSSLDDALFVDASVDASGDVTVDQTSDGGSCSPSTCPTGCCDAKGNCRVGSDDAACGSFGNQCVDCLSSGFDFCDARAKTCGHVVAQCDPSTCPNGCCENGQCLDGAGPDVCGTGGKACIHCETQGALCNASTRVCDTTTRCNASTCSGCCIGDVCVPGTSQEACGRNGSQCQNCAGQGTVCQPVSPGGLCEGQPTCGPQNCTGCCQGNVCISGLDQTACGAGGVLCSNCAQAGQQCVPEPGTSGGLCAATPTCGPQNCNGCCQGNVCRRGTGNGACGIKGEQCQRCGPNQACSGGQCTGGQLCGPQNCPGCCVGNTCASGTSDSACGAGGSACSSCAAQGLTCQGGVCNKTACGPQNCTGCCAGDVCITSPTSNQCGAGGQQCTDCTALGDVCIGGLCQTPPPPCSSATCPGCCDPTNGCVPGFTNNACGSGGAACTNCNAQGSSCDTSITPRVCKNAQTTCPAPYPSCPGTVSTPVPTIQHVCSAIDLQNARAACSGGPGTPGCASFFQFEQQVNPGCATCLAPFDVSFQNVAGLFACVAPFVSAQCDHETGCAIDCQNSSCSQCPSGATSQCINEVRANQCGSYFQQSQCVAQAFFGAGAFCNPQNYQGNFGQWLQGVGGHYCGP